MTASLDNDECRKFQGFCSPGTVPGHPAARRDASPNHANQQGTTTGLPGNSAGTVPVRFFARTSASSAPLRLCVKNSLLGDSSRTFSRPPTSDFRLRATRHPRGRRMQRPLDPPAEVRSLKSEVFSSVAFSRDMFPFAFLSLLREPWPKLSNLQTLALPPCLGRMEMLRFNWNFLCPFGFIVVERDSKPMTQKSRPGLRGFDSTRTVPTWFLYVGWNRKMRPPEKTIKTSLVLGNSKEEQRNSSASSSEIGMSCRATNERTHFSDSRFSELRISRYSDTSGSESERFNSSLYFIKGLSSPRYSNATIPSHLLPPPMNFKSEASVPNTTEMSYAID